MSAAEEHRLRRDQRDAGVERRLAQARLRDRFGFGELGFGVDAAHVVLLGFDRNRAQLHAARDLDRIGQIEFVFAIVVADPLQDGERVFAGKRHDAAVAQIDFALAWAGIGLLADGNQLVARRDQPAVAGRIGRPKRQHRNGCALGERRAQSRRACPAGSTACRRKRPEYRRAVLRSRPSPPAPHAPCRAARAERIVAAPGSTRFASAATSSWPGPTTTAVAVVPAAPTAVSTCASNDCPATACKTLGRAERMRVPSPAASTIARQVRAFIANKTSAALSYPSRHPIESRACNCRPMPPERRATDQPIVGIC